MTIILKLRGLNVKAGLEDIRKFFKHLHIPEGGVWILGGSLGEAFIAFTTEEDAQRATRYSGKLLKGTKVTIRISSMDELEHKLKLRIMKKKKSSTTRLTHKRPQLSPDPSLPSLNEFTCDHNLASPPLTTLKTPDPRLSQPFYSNSAEVQTVNSLDPNTAFLLGICTVLQNLQSSHEKGNPEAGLRVDFQKADAPPDVVKTPGPFQNSEAGYVRLFGLPASTTKEDICQFFGGLAVQEAIVNVKLGLNNGCLVKFANTQDANDALRFNTQLLGSIVVEVRGASEKMWTSALQECENPFAYNGKRETPPPNPLRETATAVQKPSLQFKRRSVNQPLNKCITKSKPDCDSATKSTPTMEHIIMARKLPKEMTKTEIKELFGCHDIAHKNVLHLLHNGNRTDTAFLIFNHIEDYDYALNLTGCHVGSDTIEVSSITKEKMRDMMAENHFRSLKTLSKRNPNQRRKSQPVETQQETDSAAQTCLYVRNLPADVNKNHIRNLFLKNKLRNENIILLCDTNGKSIGEAVVQFKSRKLAALAHGLHGQKFMGSPVFLTLINVKQMEDIVTQNA
ncbi:RNA-binding protein 12B [Solea senegalensis]|uniref:RNA-binding protein 12B n=1 Tax=Solea senegalensis TaxID=28829 RepID=A0AAV6PKC4_SOLSE|nr:RNA binding motif protein 12Ba [Solea senegalensis]KAG7464356.1 RNA-binding protein 12B [Solea senegalensis]